MHVRINKRLEAFTLMEMTVALLLTGLVTGIALTAYGIIESQFQHFQGSRNGFHEVAQLNLALQRDVQSCREVIRNDDGIYCRYQNGDQIDYAFTDEFVMRTAGQRTDTFHLKTEERSFRFEGNEQFVPELPIDAFSFKGSIQEEALPFHYFKTYGTAQLFAWEKPS